MDERYAIGDPLPSGFTVTAVNRHGRPTEAARADDTVSFGTLAAFRAWLQCPWWR